MQRYFVKPWNSPIFFEVFNIEAFRTKKNKFIRYFSWLFKALRVNYKSNYYLIPTFAKAINKIVALETHLKLFVLLNWLRIGLRQ